MTATPLAGLDAIRDALADGTEREASRYAIDGVQPTAAFEPATREEVASLLRLAAEQGLAVVPQGGRTALALGHPLQAYGIALDLGGLRRTVEYVPDDLTVTVEAGRRLGALQAELGEHGQYLTIDTPPDDDVTVGGLLATARPGAWRGHLPAARDLILGMTVAMPSGDLVSSGGRVVKNVTGYDLQRFHTGALGAFGVIVAATFKVAPLPEATRTLSATAPNLDAAVALAHRTWDASPALRALTVLTPDAARHLGLPEQPSVLLELAGTNATVDRSARDLAAAAAFTEAPGAAWSTLRRLHGDSDAAVLRAGVPPTSVGATIEAFRQAGGVAWAHLAAGGVIGRFETIEASTVAALRADAERRGGFLLVESAPPELRREVASPAGDAPLVEALRDRFDPQRTINRGRWGAML